LGDVGASARGTLIVSRALSPGLIAAAALIYVYGAAIAITQARCRCDIDSGCTCPAARRPISGWLVARNAVLAAAALAGLAPVHPRALLWVDAVTVAGATAALAACYASLDRVIAYAPRLARLRGEA